MFPYLIGSRVDRIKAKCPCGKEITFTKGTKKVYCDRQCYNKYYCKGGKNETNSTN